MKNPIANEAAPVQRFWAIPFVIVVVDQLTKLLAVAIDPNVIKNTGTVFGLFAGNPWLVTTGTIVILGVILTLLIRKQQDMDKRRFFIFAVMLIIGGGASNIIDRLLHGYVVDFIPLPLWPTFNIADFCITCGLTLLIWYSFFVKSPEK